MAGNPSMKNIRNEDEKIHEQDLNPQSAHNRPLPSFDLLIRFRSSEQGTSSRLSKERKDITRHKHTRQPPCADQRVALSMHEFDESA
jgi:hypothetical protein